MKPLPTYTPEQIDALERALFNHGETAEQLMARAGAALFSVLRNQWPDARSIGVLLGSGQNAGDGLVLARLARAEGFRIALFGWCRPAQLDGAAHKSWMALRSADPDAAVLNEEYALAPLGHFDVIVDAGFGIGLSPQRPLSAQTLAWIEYVNAARQHGTKVLAADVPSGLVAATGFGACGVQADVTVSFLALKTGLVTGRGPAVAGRIVLADLGITHQPESPDAHVLLAADPLPPKPRDGHKGSFGTVLIVAGNRGMMGAARMAAEAALRVGAGKVIVATHPEHAATLTMGRPELMVHGIDAKTSLAKLDELMAQVNAIVLGPGLGSDDWAAQLAARVLASELPLVIDADGLRFVSPTPTTNTMRIITPHPAEAARLLECETAVIEQDRLTAARALRAHYGMMGVLKGAGSVMFLPQGLLICGRGDPALATAGSGDVLAGVIGGLMALGMAPAKALPRAVCWHAIAGECVAAETGAWGAAATDLFEPIRALANGRITPPPARVALWP